MTRRAHPLWPALLLLVVAVGLAPPAQGQELFSWWRRGLLPLELAPGSWVEVERSEAAEGQVVVDTVRVEVLGGAPEGRRWVQLDTAGDRWLLLLDLGRVRALERGGSLLDALERLLQAGPGGTLREEDLAELRSRRLVRRHFEDLFEDPRLETSALPDTQAFGRTLPRQRALLVEEREQRTPMGPRTLVQRTRIRSTAVLSAAMPITGVLRSATTVVVESEWEGGKSGARRPPLVTELGLRTLACGHSEPRPAPAP